MEKLSQRSIAPVPIPTLQASTWKVAKGRSSIAREVSASPSRTLSWSVPAGAVSIIGLYPGASLQHRYAIMIFQRSFVSRAISFW